VEAVGETDPDRRETALEQRAARSLDGRCGVAAGRLEVVVAEPQVELSLVAVGT